MSEFSIMLEKFIKEKEVQTSELARCCGMDRKSLFKLIQGKEELPEESVIQKMSLYMKLTPFEWHRFYEAYQISLIGKERYFVRRQVQDLIGHFPECFHPATGGNITELLPEKNKAEDRNCIPLGNQMEVNQWIHRIVLQEAKEHKNSKICMIMQADYSFVFDLVQSLKKIDRDLEIEHVTCVDASNDISEDMEFYNLTYMKNILPLYISGMSYHLYSISEDIQACRKDIEGFSNLILTSDYGLLCTSDFRKGIVYQAEEVLDYLRDRYRQYKNKGELRFRIIDNVQQQVSVLGDMGWDKRISYALQPEPCLLSLLTPDIMEAAIRKEIPGRRELLTLAVQFIEKTRARVEKGINFFYCTKEGLDRFASEGCFPEIPSEIYRPLLPEERITLIKEAVHLCERGIFRFMKPPLDHLAVNLHLCINEKEGYLLFRNMNGQNVYLIIHDKKLLLAFWDYLSSMDEKLLYTEEETAEYFREVLRKVSSASTI